jgi:histone H3/H4
MIRGMAEHRESPISLDFRFIALSRIYRRKVRFSRFLARVRARRYLRELVNRFALRLMGIARAYAAHLQRYFGRKKWPHSKVWPADNARIELGTSFAVTAQYRTANVRESKHRCDTVSMRE